MAATGLKIEKTYMPSDTFLKRIFQKLMLNFLVGQKGRRNENDISPVVFGLDNIGELDRTAAAPDLYRAGGGTVGWEYALN